MADSRGGYYVLFYDASRVGRVAHLLNTAPDPGVGWHSACGRMWADGARTSLDQWSGIRARNADPRCRNCSGRLRSDSTAIDALSNPEIGHGPHGSSKGSFRADSSG